METAEQILVIFLSAALGVLLALAITVAIMAIRFMKRLQQVVDKADRIVSSAESFTEIFRRSTGPLTILRFARSIADAVAKHKSK